MKSAQAAGVPSSRRERHKQRAKQRLYECALELFAQKGYENTTVDEITEKADVARGTFFNYFPRKEDVVSWWGEKRRESLREYMGMMEPQEDEPPQEPDSVIAELERCMSALGKMNEEEWSVTPSMLAAWVRAGNPITEEPYAANIFADIIRRGIARSQIKDTTDPVLVGNILRDVYLGTLYRWSQYEKLPRPLRDELLEILHVVLDGILLDSDRDS